MMSEAKKRGLGRGLSALLPGGPPPGPVSPVGPGIPGRSTGPLGPTSMTAAVPPAPAPRPRTYFATSMKAHGVIVPLVVRPRPEGGYFLIAGERRWRAAQRAGLHEVPVVVQDVAQGTALERALIENLQRADLGPLEEASAYQRLVEEFGLTQEEVAERIGKDRSTVANAIRLLKLPAPVRQLVEDERLSMGHARALLALEDPAGIERAARQVVDRQLSVRATEALVKKAREPDDRTPPARPPKSASVRDLEDRLTRALGGPVTITEDEPGKAGRIEIRYMNLDHLERLLDRLL